MHPDSRWMPRGRVPIRRDAMPIARDGADRGRHAAGTGTGTGNAQLPRVTLIPGDGIGPEISKAVKDIFSAAKVRVAAAAATRRPAVAHDGRTGERDARTTAQVPLIWEEIDVTPRRDSTGRIVLPAELMESMARTRVGLKGAV